MKYELVCKGSTTAPGCGTTFTAATKRWRCDACNSALEAKRRELAEKREKGEGAVYTPRRNGMQATYTRTRFGQSDQQRPREDDEP